MPNLKLKKSPILKNSSKKADKIEIEAAYWGVKPRYIRSSNIKNGIKKKREVINTILIFGKLWLSIGFKLYILQ